MTDAEFSHRITQLVALEFREDFQTALYDLYVACQPHQRATLRRDLAAKRIHEPHAWRNPTDYFRSDLTTEQKARRSLLRLSMIGPNDTREDLRELAHAYHALLILGFNADSILEDTARMAEPPTSDFIRAFVARDPQNKSMEAFRLRVVQSPNGPTIDALP